MTLKKKSFENILGKAENIGNQHFLLFPKCYLPFPICRATYILSTANALNLDQSKILLFSKELITLRQNSGNTVGKGAHVGYDFRHFLPFFPK